MSETKWTKGPWAAEQNLRGDGVPLPGWDIIGGITGDEFIGEIAFKHDAALAAAAPDLAEALEDMLHAHPPISMPIGGAGSRVRRAQEDQEAAIAKARAALARAKGAA